MGLDFGPTTYYDGQQLMAKGADGFNSMSTLDEIEGAVVCAIAGTTTEKNMTEAAASMGVNITLSTFEDFNVVVEGFKSGACDVVTSDGSTLVSRKATEGAAGEDWVIFPSVPISKEPLGPSLDPEPVPLRRCGYLDGVRDVDRRGEGHQLFQCG